MAPPTPDAERLAAVVAAASAVALVKDLVSIPAEWLGPADFADRAAESVAGLPVTVEVFDEEALREGGFGGILGVGQGSDRPPRLVRLEYAPEGADRHVALVGKGITFDTGGLSLKPAASMVGMKYDMCGAATALAVLRAVATLGAPGPGHRLAVHRRQHAVGARDPPGRRAAHRSTAPRSRCSTPTPKDDSCSPTDWWPRAASVPT